MCSAVRQLLAALDEGDPFDYDVTEVRAVQFAAANERLQRARDTIPVVSKRAADIGTQRIDSLRDIVPLFFSDATYKSYPDSLVTARKWRSLGSWLDALSADSRAADIDTTGVNDLDDWLVRLREHGYATYVSSGTSGRCSLYRVSEADRALDRRMWEHAFRWSTGATPDQSRVGYVMCPRQGWHRMMDIFNQTVSEFCRPDTAYFLGDGPLRVTDVNQLGRLRKDIAAGTASPSDIQTFESASAARQREIQDAFSDMADAVVRHQDEPAMFLGTWAQQYALAQAASERGLRQAHPDSVAFAGGGLKGIDLPADYRDQVYNRLGLDQSRYLFAYGVSEVTAFQIGCECRRYHVPPWTIPLVVDQPGDLLVDPHQDTLQGRLAFFDLTLEGRWGALITGDRVTLHLDPCPCGRRSPSIDDTIMRYADLPGGDDRVTCAGTIDSYVRGFIGGEGA